MNIDFLKEARNLLFRTLLVTFVLAVFMQLATIGLWDVWTTIAAQCFHTNKEELGPLLFNFFAAVKFFAIFVLLAPALALHWTIRSKVRLP